MKETIYILIIVAILTLFCSCASFKTNPILSLGLGEIGYTTASYLFKDTSPKQLEVYRTMCINNLINLNEYNVEIRVEQILKTINNLLAKNNKIDPEMARYINKGITLLNLALDIKETSKPEAIIYLTYYLKGVIEEIDILLLPKLNGV